MQRVDQSERFELVSYRWRRRSRKRVVRARSLLFVLRSHLRTFLSSVQAIETRRWRKRRRGHRELARRRSRRGSSRVGVDRSCRDPQGEFVLVARVDRPRKVEGCGAFLEESRPMPPSFRTACYESFRARDQAQPACFVDPRPARIRDCDAERTREDLYVSSSAFCARVVVRSVRSFSFHEEGWISGSHSVFSKSVALTCLGFQPDGLPFEAKREVDVRSFSRRKGRLGSLRDEMT